MATRVYFNGAASAPVTPSSFSAGWNRTTSASNIQLLSVKIGGAVSTIGNTASGTSGHFTCVYRGVSEQLQSQTISGTIKGQMACSQTNTTDDYTVAIAIKVIKSDLSDRGVLLAVTASDDATTEPPEMLTSLENRQLLDASESATISLSSLAVSDGDRLVIEMGFRQASTSVASGTLLTRADSGSSDLPEDNTTTGSSLCPWVEFSSDITFAPIYAGSSSTPADSAAATNTADPTAVTPPSGMLAGDLVCMIGQQRATGVALAVSATGGQTWNSLTAIGLTNNTARVFWCVYNGTWSTDPSVDFTATTCNSVQMHVFRPSGTTYTWEVNQAQVELDTAGSPATITGQTTTGTESTVTLAGWFTPDDNTWGSLSGTGWAVTGSAQYRNTSGQDQSASYAHKIQTAAAATGNVTKTQTANGPDAGSTFIVTFNQVTPASPFTWFDQSPTSLLLPGKFSKMQVTSY